MAAVSAITVANGFCDLDCQHKRVAGLLLGAQDEYDIIPITEAPVFSRLPWDFPDLFRQNLFVGEYKRCWIFRHAYPPHRFSRMPNYFGWTPGSYQRITINSQTIHLRHIGFSYLTHHVTTHTDGTVCVCDNYTNNERANSWRSFQYKYGERMVYCLQLKIADHPTLIKKINSNKDEFNGDKGGGGKDKGGGEEKDLPPKKKIAKKSSAISPHGSLGIGVQAPGFNVISSTSQQQPNATSQQLGQQPSGADVDHARNDDQLQQNLLGDSISVTAPNEDDSRVLFDTLPGMPSYMLDPVQVNRDGPDFSPGQPSSSLGVIGRRSNSELGAIGDPSALGPMHDQMNNQRLLEAAFERRPQPADSERPRPYFPRNPAITPPTFPQTQAPIINNPLLWERLGSDGYGTDTLFFAFYHQQDPKEKAKSETRDWLNNKVSELESQVDSFEAELEGLSVKKGKTRPPRLTHLETSITRHKDHIIKLELILRLLDNDELSPEQVNDVKDFLDDCVERNQDDFEEFSDVDELYSTLPLDVLEGLVKGTPLSMKSSSAASASQVRSISLPTDHQNTSQEKTEDTNSEAVPKTPSPNIGVIESVLSSVDPSQVHKVLPQETKLSL